MVIWFSKLSTSYCSSTSIALDYVLKKGLLFDDDVVTVTVERGWLMMLLCRSGAPRRFLYHSYVSINPKHSEKRRVAMRTKGATEVDWWRAYGTCTYQQ